MHSLLFAHSFWLIIRLMSCITKQPLDFFLKISFVYSSKRRWTFRHPLNYYLHLRFNSCWRTEAQIHTYQSPLGDQNSNTNCLHKWGANVWCGNSAPISLHPAKWNHVCKLGPVASCAAIFMHTVLSYNGEQHRDEAGTVRPQTTSITINGLSPRKTEQRTAWCGAGGTNGRMHPVLFIVQNSNSPRVWVV